MNASVVLFPFSYSYDFTNLKKIENRNLSSNIRKQRTELIRLLQVLPRKFYKETAHSHSKRAGTILRNISRRNNSTLFGMSGDCHDFDEDFKKLLIEAQLNPENKFNKFFLENFDQFIEYNPLSSLAYAEESNSFSSDASYSINILTRTTELLNKKNIEHILRMSGEIDETYSKEAIYEKTIQTYLSREGIPNLGPSKAYYDVDLTALFTIKTKEIDMQVNMDIGMEPDLDFLKEQYRLLSRKILEKNVKNDKLGDIKDEQNYVKRMVDLFYQNRNKTAGRYIEFGVPLFERSLDFDSGGYRNSDGKKLYSEIINPQKDKERFTMARDFAKAIYRKEI